MKFSKNAVVFLLLVLLTLSSCQKNGNEPNEQELSIPTINNDSFEIIEGDGIVLTELVQIPFAETPGTQGDEKCEAVFFGDELLIESWDDAGRIHYSKFSLTDKKLTLIGNTPPFSMGSGDYIMTDNNEAFTSFNFKGENNVATLVKIDTVNNKVTELEKTECYPPFERLKTAKNNIILKLGTKPISSTTDYPNFEYYIDSFSLDNKSSKSLVKKVDRSKGGVTCFDYCNERIYTAQFEVLDNTVKNFIQCYTLSGEEAERYELDFLQDLPEDERAIMTMDVFENYFILNTLGLQMFILRADGDVLNVVYTENIPTEGNRYVKSPQKKDEFGCFYNVDENFILRFDAERRCFVKQEIMLDNKYKLASIKENEKGRLLVCISDTTKENEKFEHYERYDYYLVEAI